MAGMVAANKCQNVWISVIGFTALAMIFAIVVTAIIVVGAVEIHRLDP
jgi:hypothetical protein